jgi:hypothetical protein
MLIGMKKAAGNDNFDSWTPLGLATAVILNRLRCEARLLELQTDSPEKGVENDKRDNERTAREEKEDQRRLVERRLR